VRALGTLRRPQIPHKLVEPLSDDALRRLLDAASVRDRAIGLIMLDTGLRLSEVAGLRRCDLRPDGSVKVLGKGSRERVVPVGNTARQARCATSDRPKAPIRASRSSARGAEEC